MHEYEAIYRSMGNLSVATSQRKIISFLAAINFSSSVARGRAS